MQDAIQEALVRWTRDGDRSAGERAAIAVLAEWAGPVRRFWSGRAEDEVEEALQDAVVALLTGRAPRAIAPEGVTSPRAWRQRVLRNHLLDRARRQRTQRRTVEAVALEPVEVLMPPDISRQCVLRHLPSLEVGRRVALALALGMDPTAWVDELAEARREPTDAVAARVARALWDSEARQAVLYPEASGRAAAESWRKLVERARDDLARRVSA